MSPDFGARSSALELMDESDIPADELLRTLQELANINRLLGGYGASLDAVAALVPPGLKRLRVLDVGCGGGETAARIAAWAEGRGISVEVHGIDLLEPAVNAARGLSRPGLSFSRRNLFDIPESESYDVVHAALMLHHCPGPDAVRALRKMRALSRLGVAINDLHRHPAAYYAIAALTTAFSRNRLIRHDAALSVLRAFSRGELRALFQEAGLPEPENPLALGLPLVGGGASMTIPKQADVAIVGAGPAGSALAALLAQAGRKPVLLEKDFFPRPKLCGEFLSAESQELLRRAGCLDAVLAASPATITEARFFSPSGRRFEFPLGGQALSLSRRSFDDILFRHARDMGASAFEGVEVKNLIADENGTELEYERRDTRGNRERGRLRAGRVIAAYGRRSALDVRAGRGSADAARVGFKRRHVLAPGSESLANELRGHVEIHLFDGGYCGLSVVEDGSVNVCALADARRLAPLPSSRWEHLSAALGRGSPSLRARLENLIPEGETISVAQLRFDARSASEGPLLFIGDAAGMIAPLCGDGQAMALESAVALAGLMLKSEGQDLSRRWDELWNARFSSRMKIGRLLNGLLTRPLVAEAAALAAGRFPSLGQALVSATRGELSPDPRRRGSVNNSVEISG